LLIFYGKKRRIKIGRSTVTTIKNQVEQQAKKWYIELRESGSKYVAAYKERLDSLLSYQKKLHDIISSTEKPEVQGHFGTTQYRNVITLLIQGTPTV